MPLELTLRAQMESLASQGYKHALCLLWLLENVAQAIELDLLRVQIGSETVVLLPVVSLVAMLGASSPNTGHALPF